MGYRKIDVDGVEHQYTVGRTHVKVRGIGATPKELVAGYTGPVREKEFRQIKVEPHMIADHIRKALV